MDNIRIPNLLNAGDTIGIVAPGRKLNCEVLDQAVSILKTWGVNVQLGENIYSERHSYLSGSDEERLSDFQTMMDDPKVKCILCARGGYGSSRFIDQLDFTSLQVNPKWLVGFSDVTALHLKFLEKGVASIHGTMPVLFPRSESTSSVNALRQLLFDGTCSIESTSGFPNRTGTASGVLVGGNLSLIVESLGTKSEIETQNRILIIEEVDEYSYRLDRMMNQLFRAGKFNSLAGLVFGHMTDIKEGDIHFGESIIEMVNRLTKGTNYPIAFQFPSGHENPNYPWVQGFPAELTVTGKQSKLRQNVTKIHS